MFRCNEGDMKNDACISSKTHNVKFINWGALSADG